MNWLIQGLVVWAVGVLIGSIWQHQHVKQLRTRLMLARPRRPAIFGGKDALTVPRQGLIFTVGRQKDTILFCLNQQRPQRVGFLCTTGTCNIGIEVIEEPQVSDFLTEENSRIECCDPMDIEDIRTKTKSLFDWLGAAGIPPTNVALDVTGGLTSMSVCAFSVSEELGIDSEYVRSDFDEKNRPIPGTQKLVFIAQHSGSPDLDAVPALPQLQSSPNLANPNPSIPQLD